jgi:hypothetical protein
MLFAVEGEGNEAVMVVDVKEAGPWRGWVCGGREGRGSASRPGRVVGMSRKVMVEALWW